MFGLHDDLTLEDKYLSILLARDGSPEEGISSVIFLSRLLAVEANVYVDINSATGYSIAAPNRCRIPGNRNLKLRMIYRRIYRRADGLYTSKSSSQLFTRLGSCPPRPFIRSAPERFDIEIEGSSSRWKLPRCEDDGGKEKSRDNRRSESRDGTLRRAFLPEGGHCRASALKYWRNRDMRGRDCQRSSREAIIS